MRVCTYIMHVLNARRFAHALCALLFYANEKDFVLYILVYTYIYTCSTYVWGYKYVSLPARGIRVTFL